ncbi:MAG: glycosyltransferase [Planctomycetes bacterium]|nr:glycosyltransferase [Planctomycetota bacterium]
MKSPDLSLAVVNYNSAALLDGMLGSALADQFMVGGREGRLELLVVDNASRHEDHRELAAVCSRHGARLLRNSENVGYAIANNQALQAARGRWHMVSNPDVLIRPGCVQHLLDALETLPQAALTGPLASMDLAGEVLLPPNELPETFSESLVNIARSSDGVARFHVRRRARYAHRYWTAAEPMRLPMLSGGFFLGRRDTFLRHGLFDPGYPLYFEDTDLFRRYHQRDLALWHIPAARIVHHFSRSALPRMKAAMFRNSLGARRYFNAHFGAAGSRACGRLIERAAEHAVDQRCPFPLTVLEPSAQAPRIVLPQTAGVYVEVSGNAKFSLTVGLFPQQVGAWQVPQAFWDSLACTHYWLRTVNPATGDTIEAWRATRCPAM